MNPNNPPCLCCTNGVGTVKQLGEEGWWCKNCFERCYPYRDADGATGDWVEDLPFAEVVERVNNLADDEPICICCATVPGYKQDPSGEWWCNTCLEICIEQATLGGISVEDAQKAVAAVVQEWNKLDTHEEQARLTALLDEAIADETAGYTIAPPKPGYAEQVGAPLDWKTVVALQKELKSGNYARYKRAGGQG